MLIRSTRQSAADIKAWESWAAQDALVGRQRSHLRRVDVAVRELRAFAVEGLCYAGTSWGKDSTVLAHLVARLAAEGIVIPLVSIAIQPTANPDCRLVRDAFLARHPVLYDEIEVWSERSEYGWIWHGTLEAGFRVAVARYGDRYASGVRAEESGSRKRRMQRWGHASARTCAPIGWWSADDVFAYLHAHDLPVHPAYAMTWGGRLDRGKIRVAMIGGKRGDGIGRTEWERTYYADRLQAAPGDHIGRLNAIE